ncbi:HAD family hydrolase [Fusobacterium ulcerans]|uniref:HAD family hydrolase n=1 Tax=Fusobacterium ulcerans TaxID=861 RepID=UPI001032FD40|nr:HAD family hydrolase [Fusobacterium ulcerans]
MKLLFSDFDRTLYVDRNITKENLDAVNKWQVEGNLFIITTGRHKKSIIEQMENFSLKPDYYICNNGAVILDKEKNIIFSKCISNQMIEEIIEYICENYENSFEIIEKERTIKIMNNRGIDNHNPTDIILDRVHISSIKDVVQLHKKFDKEERVAELVIDLNTKFRSSLAAYANVLNVDIVANGMNKSTGIDFICREISNVDDILVIGDSYNDIEMVQKYNGFTVEHGNEDIKKIAREIFFDVASLLKKYS